MNKKRLTILVLGCILVLGLVTALIIWLIPNGDKKVNAIVNDTEKPILSGVKNITFTGKEEFDLYSHLEMSDNSNGKLDINISGEYDLTVNGEYELTYVLKDESGNQTEEKFTLTVNIDKGSPTSIVSYKTITPKGYELEVIDGVAYIEGYIIVNKSYSISKNYDPGKMVNLKKGHPVVSSIAPIFNQMVADASQVGLNIYDATCYRSYSFQNTLYTNYIKRDGKEAAETYSARPGYSEHHTGLAIDLNTVNNAFASTAESKWINDNCHKYGFIIRYPKGSEEITGYQYEPWHLRYVGEDLAKKLYNDGNWITMEEYFGLTSVYDK